MKLDYSFYTGDKKLESKLEEAEELINEILEDLPELPDKASDFADSSESIVNSISEWVEKKEFITDKQLIALRNIHSGIQRWLERAK